MTIPRITNYRLVINPTVEMTEKFEIPNDEYVVNVDASDYAKFVSGEKSLEDAFHYISPRDMEILKYFYETKNK